jgi:hypothetical protein
MGFNMERDGSLPFAALETLAQPRHRSRRRTCSEHEVMSATIVGRRSALLDFRADEDLYFEAHTA